MWKPSGWWFISLCFLLLKFSFAHAQQKQGAIWRMGNWEINFNHVPRTITQIPGYPQNALSDFVYCDKNGKMLCLTNCRDSIRNRFGQKMAGKEPLLPYYNRSWNDKIFVPDPGDEQKVYLIQTLPIPLPAYYDSLPFSYIHIDFRLDSGRGDVLSPKFVVIDSTFGIPLGSALNRFEIMKRPGKNEYVLIYFHRVKRRVVFRIISAQGISGEILGSDSIQFGFEPSSGSRSKYIKVSPDGKYLVVNTRGSTVEKNAACLLKLDLNTLWAEKWFFIPNFQYEPQNWFEVVNAFCFSPGSKFLYMLDKGSFSGTPTVIPHLGQYRLDLPDSASIVGSRVSMPVATTGYSVVEHMQIGLDGKIYFSTRTREPNPATGIEEIHLNQINCPDIQGAGCGIQQKVQLVAVQNRYFDMQAFSIQNTSFFVNAFRFQAQADQDTICAGDSVLLSAYGAGAETFEWRVLGNQTVVSTQSNYKVAPLQTTTYRVKGGSGCGQKDTIVTVHVVPRPQSPFGADTGFCGNQWKRFTATALPKGRFFWQSNIDTTVNTKDSASVQVRFPKVEAPTPGYLFVRIQNPGCVVEDSLKLTLLPTTTLKPITTPKGDTAICQGETLVASAQNPLGFGLVWSNGQTSSQISLNQAGQYSVRILNEYNCPGDSAFQFTLTVHPLPIAQTLANGKKDTTVCFPGKVNLGIEPQPNVSYSWQGQTDSLSNSQISNPSISFQNQDTLVKIVNCQLFTVHSLTGCRNKDTLTLKLVPYLRPDAGADRSFCNENQPIIGQKGYAGYAYQWSPETGLQSPNAAQSTTNLTNPGFENTLNQRYIRTVSLLGCVAKDTVEVSVYPQVPKPILSGPQFVCPGVQNVPYQLSTLPAVSNYQLSIFHFQLTGGDSVARIRINWKEENPNGGIKLKLGNVYGCQPDSVFLPVNITRNLRPQTQITPGLNDSLCLANAQNIPYNIAPFNPQSRYRWNINPQTITTTNPTDYGILTTYHSAGLYTLKLTESDTTAIAQCFGETEYTVRIWPQPTAKAIVGKDSVCHLGNEQLTIDNVQWNSQYNWTASRGSIENETANGGKVNFNADFDLQTDYGQAEIRNRETSDKGCLGPENTKMIVVESLPVPSIVPPKDNLEWQSLESRSYEAMGRPGSTFNWEAENGSIVSGQGTSQVSINWLPDQLRYRLKVQEITRIGCLGESVFQTIPYDSAIFIPNLISPNGDGKNDQLEIRNLHFYPENQLTIFDRWGKKVFEAEPYQQDWPTERLSNGLYYFSFSAGGKVLKGWVMVAE